MMHHLKIHPIGTLMVEGETSSGVQSFADAWSYRITGTLGIDFSAVLQYQVWHSGEKDVVCTEAQGSNVLNTIIGRMRLGIYSLDDGKNEWIALKTAQLKRIHPAHATLCKASLNFYTELLNIDLPEELNAFGICKVGNKETLLNENGKTRCDLCAIFEAGKIEVPLAAFILTRIAPLIKNEG
jgi:hypothetical protein